MKAADYQCKCGEIREIFVPDDEPIPKFIMCYKCNDKAKRKFSATPAIIYQGRTGNAKNGYQSSPVKIKKT